MSMNISSRLYMTLVLIVQLVYIVESAREEDLVNQIPGYPEYRNFKIYSGQLVLDEDNVIQKSIHYVYITSMSELNPEQDPLVLWLNGGPGCSSMQGWLKEFGPYMMPDGKSEFETELNEYAWNKNANILFFESPAGVGFSINNEFKYPIYGDQFTHNDNYNALTKFLEFFPELQKNKFYITGESYAGVYIPHLANLINIKNTNSSNMYINLIGIAVGNGVTDWSIRQNAQIEFAWSHQLISTELYTAYKSACSLDTLSPRCKFTTSRIRLQFQGINPYDIYGFCYGSPQQQQQNSHSDFIYTYIPWSEFNNNELDNNNNLKLTPPCIDDVGISNFLNRQDVKQALHVNIGTTWQVCNGPIGKKYQKDVIGSLQIYPELFKSGIQILFFSGDTDFAVPFNEFYFWNKKLTNFNVIQEQTKWIVDSDVAGFYTKFNHNFTFLTVKGAGHMVPTCKRKEAFAMFTRFLQGGNY